MNKQRIHYSDFYEWTASVLEDMRLSSYTEIKNYANIIKETIHAIESTDDVRISKAIKKFNKKLPQTAYTALLNFQGGQLRLHSGVIKGYREFCPEAGQIIQTKVAQAIENLKSFWDRDWPHTYIGVCQYDGCGRFYYKTRKDQRYCSPSHKKLAWQKAKRAEGNQ